jgi:hypothetical protein
MSVNIILCIGITIEINSFVDDYDYDGDCEIKIIIMENFLWSEMIKKLNIEQIIILL